MMLSKRSIVFSAALVLLLPAGAAFGQADDPHGLLEAKERALRGPARNEVAKVEPEHLDFGEMNRGDKKTKKVTITNTSDAPIKINRAFATCGCTVPTVPSEWIEPGASVAVGIEMTGKNPGPAHSTVRFFLDEAKGDISVGVSATVRHPILAEPRIYPSDLSQDLAISLTSTDENEFQIMAVDPPVLDGVDDSRRKVHNLTLNAAKLAEAGARKFRIRIYTDHPRIDSVLLRSDRIQATDEVTQFLAWARGQGPVVDLAKFMESGLGVDDGDPQGRTALMYAALMGDLERVQALLDFGADVNATTTDQRTPLMHAAQTVRGSADVVRLLLDAGSDVNARDQFGRSALYWAARGADAERINLLIERGADVNLQGPSNETTLIAAVKSQQPENVMALLEAGADPTVSDSKGRRPIDHAKVFLARSRNAEMRARADEIRTLLEAAGE